MPQPSEGHCKNFQILKLNMRKPKNTCLRPTTPINLQARAKDNAKNFEDCDKELVTFKGQLNKVQHEN